MAVVIKLRFVNVHSWSTGDNSGEGGIWENVIELSEESDHADGDA